MGVGCPGGGFHLLRGGPRGAVGDIGPDGVVEQNRLLTHDAQGAPKGGQLEVANICAVDQHRSAGDIVETPQNVHDARLSRAAGTHEGHDGARLHLEGNVLEDGLPFAVFEADVPVLDSGGRHREGAGPRTVLDLDGRVEELEHALGSDEARLDQRRQLAQVLHGGVQLGAQHDEPDELLPRQDPLHDDHAGAIPEEQGGAQRHQHFGHGRSERAELDRAEERVEVASRQSPESLPFQRLGGRGLHQADPRNRFLDVRTDLARQM